MNVDISFIESLGWEYGVKTQDHHFKLVKTTQPFNLVYRSFRMAVGIHDNRVKISGFEYQNFSPSDNEEVLFEGGLITDNKEEELKLILKQVGINE